MTWYFVFVGGAALFGAVIFLIEWLGRRSDSHGHH